MPYKERPVEKLYHTIGEVAEPLGVNTSELRYWEKEFGGLKANRTGKGDRLYTKDDIATIERIHHLVKEKGFTIQGAKDALKAKETVRTQAEELADRLTAIRQGLIDLRDELEPENGQQ